MRCKPGQLISFNDASRDYPVSPGAIEAICTVLCRVLPKKGLSPSGYGGGLKTAQSETHWGNPREVIDS
jgi:hypothetical protein